MCAFVYVFVKLCNFSFSLFVFCHVLSKCTCMYYSYVVLYVCLHVNLNTSQVKIPSTIFVCCRSKCHANNCRALTNSNKTNNIKKRNERNFIQTQAHVHTNIGYNIGIKNYQNEKNLQNHRKILFFVFLIFFF